MQWLFAIRPVSQVLTVESILGKLRPPEIELSVLNQSWLAAKEVMDGGGTGVEFALDSPFIELLAAEPQGGARLEMFRAAEPQGGARLEMFRPTTLDIRLQVSVLIVPM